MKPTINQNRAINSSLALFTLVFISLTGYGQVNNLLLAQDLYYHEISVNYSQDTHNQKLIAVNTNTTLETASAFASEMASYSLLAVEVEQEMEIEEWMLNAFSTNKKHINVRKLIIQDSEQEQILEEWMLDLQTW